MACPLGCRDEKGEVSRVERRGVETHRTCCPMRTVKCEYCSVSVKACDMDGHLEVCEEFPIPCPNKCSEEFRVKKKDKSIHLSQECPLQETECPYSQYGCGVKVLRRDLDQHEKEYIHKHMKLTITNMECKIIMLRKENAVLATNAFKCQSLLKKEKETANALENMVENVQMNLPEQEKENERFKNSMLSKMLQLEQENELFRRVIPIGSLEWRIHDLKNKISRNEYVWSDPFYVGLYKFQGRIAWSQGRNLVDLFLHILKGEWDDSLKWPIRYKFLVILVNQLDGRDNYKIYNETTEEDLKNFPEFLSKPKSARGNEGITNTRFISLADLLHVKYSIGDRIIIKISVELILNLES